MRSHLWDCLQTCIGELRSPGEWQWNHRTTGCSSLSCFLFHLKSASIRGPWVIDNPGSLERSSKAVSNVLGCFRRSQSPQCIKASILTSLPLVPHTVETRCTLIQGECYVDLDSAQGTLKLRTPEQQGSPRFLRLLGRPSPSKPDHHWGKRMPQLRPMPQLQQMPQPHPMVQVIQCQRQDSLDEPGVQMECLQMRVQRWKSKLNDHTPNMSWTSFVCLPWLWYSP